MIRWKNRKTSFLKKTFFFYLKSTFLVLSIKSFLGFTIVPARGIEVDLGIFVIFFTIVITKDVWAFLLFLVISLLLLKKRCLLLFLFLLLNKKYLWLFLFRSSFSSLLVQAIALVPSKNPIKLNLSSLHIFTRVRFHSNRRFFTKFNHIPYFQYCRSADMYIRPFSSKLRN